MKHLSVVDNGKRLFRRADARAEVMAYDYAAKTNGIIFPVLAFDGYIVHPRVPLYSDVSHLQLRYWSHGVRAGVSDSHIFH